MTAESLVHHGRDASTGRRKSAREYLYLYLPDLPLRQACIEKGWQMEGAIGLYARHQHTDRLVYLSLLAGKAGLSAGMGVADAKARLPDIRLAEVRPEQDRFCLEKLARWAWRYSPRTGIDEAGCGIWLDMTGTSHLYGGIKQVIADIYRRLSCLNISVYCAAAPYYSAARALAYYHPLARKGVVVLSSRRALMQILSEFPLSVLWLEEGVVQALSQAGLRRIGHLQPLSYAQLAIRFGPELVQKWAMLSGNRDDTPTATGSVPALWVSHSWPEPLAGLESWQQMTDQMIKEIADMLFKAEMAASCFELGWQASDGTIGRLYFNLSRPGRSRDILSRLMAGAAEHIDAEFGLDYSWLQAHKLAAELPETGWLGTDASSLQSRQIDHVLDILAARLGTDKVQRVTHHSCWQINDSMVYQPLADAHADKSWDMAVPAHLTAPRPLRLFEPAEPVYVVALLPDHPPAMLRWRRKNWQIVRATGPERIGPRWWDADQKGIKTRDYYRVETGDGRRLWVYREGLPERGETAEWFVHGCFA